MAQQHTFHALFVIGVIFLAIMLVRLFVNRRWCPPMLVFLLIGIIVGQVVNGDMASEHLSIRTILSALGEAGLIMLLFKVGINADLKGLRAQLPNASWIWLWNVVLSGGLGYVAAYWILSLDVITSLFIAIAFTATSVGVTVSLWSEAGKLSTPQGILLLDVAELDDLSTIC